MIIALINFIRDKNAAGAPSIASRITTLNNKSCNNPVNDQIIVKTISAKRNHIRSMNRSIITK